MLAYICLLLFTQFVQPYQKPIVVVIPSYNNAQWYKRNLDSVCFQNYSNYRIIYIDDCSTDQTASLVLAYIAEHGLYDKVIFISNSKRYGAMANHYKAVWMCQDDEIVVHLDGDDWFKHNDVLQTINQYYQDPNIWLTYGQFERYPDGKKGYCRPIAHGVIAANAFRECDWFTSHVRTFYAGLFKQIQLKDFMYNGAFFSVTCDMAMFFPLLELSGFHTAFIEEVLYVYNEATPHNDYKIHLRNQLHCDKVIRSRTKYAPAHDYHRMPTSTQVDVIVFFTGADCADLLLQLTLDKHINTVTVLYSDRKLFERSLLMEQFAQIKYVHCADDVATAIQHICTTPGYLLCMYDTTRIVRPLSLDKACSALEQTQAVAFHYNVGKDAQYSTYLSRKQRVPPLVELCTDICAWQYKDAEFDWKFPYNMLCLCRKADLACLLEDIQCATCDEYIRAIHSHVFDTNQIGLCFNRTCMMHNGYE